MACVDSILFLKQVRIHAILCFKPARIHASYIMLEASKNIYNVTDKWILKGNLYLVTGIRAICIEEDRPAALILIHQA